MAIFVNWDTKEFRTSLLFNICREPFFCNDFKTDDKITFKWVNAKKYSGTESYLRREIDAIEVPTSIIATYVIIEQDGSCRNLNYSKIVEKVDYINNNSCIFSLLNDTGSGKGYFIDQDCFKLVVIDHVENINQDKEIYNLIAKLITTAGKYIFIMLNKTDELDSQNFKSAWSAIWKQKPSGGEYNFLDRQRNETTLKPFTDDEIEMIISDSTLFFDDEKKTKIIDSINKFPEYLHRAYYLDRFLYYLSSNDVPENMENFSVQIALYGETLSQINKVNFNDFKKAAKSKGIFSLDFMHNATQTFLRSYFIATNWETLDDKAIMSLFMSEDECFLKKDSVTQVLKEVFLVFVNDDKKLKAFFEKFIKYSNFTAAIVGEIACMHKDKMNRYIIEDIFVMLCDIYSEDISLCDGFNECEGNDIEKCNGGIKLKFEIGKVIGKFLIAKYINNNEFIINRELIQDKLGCFFNTVAENYVVPQVNDYGISVNPITNFEYEKFQRDINYSKIAGLPTAKEARERYYIIFSAIFDFIEKASIIHPKNQESRRKLAKILKGVDWLHYISLVEVINSLANKGKDKEYELLKRVLKMYYPDSISGPVMWGNSYDCNAMFCNPLQPVVGMSLAEAKAYANWLSKKIKKNVRVVKNLDYINIIGQNNITFSYNKGDVVADNDAQSIIKKDLKAKRTKFIDKYDSKGVRFFNCRNNYKCFYGKDVTSEPTTIGLFPNNKIEGLFDVCGNVFEMIDDHYNGNGVQDGCHIDEEKERLPLWAKMYNCGGGGWQHKDDKFSPKYMGQFTGFTRNQDIGFRIVIDRIELKYSIKSIEKQKQNKSKYSTESSIHTYYEQPDICDEPSMVSLEAAKITNPPIGEKIEVCRELLPIGTVFRKNGSPSDQLRFYGKDNQPKIILVSKGFEIFAYELIEIASATTEDTLDSTEQIKVIKLEHIEPLPHTDGAKNFSNCDMADILQAIIWESSNTLRVFTTKIIDITSGYFRIDKSKKKGFDANSLWYIRYRKKENVVLFDKIKSSLSEKWYMPDWVDLFLLLDLLNDNQANDIDPTVNANKMMTTLSIIDTAEMHMSIYNSTHEIKNT